MIYQKNPKMSLPCYWGLVVLIISFCLIVSDIIYAQDTFAEASVRKAALEQSTFVQIPGPNPIITPGPDGSWDDDVVEAADAFEDEGRYYLYYHACGDGKGYRLGVASAGHPLGPFKKHGDKPVLDLGPEGSWEDVHVACAMVMRAGDEEDEKYYMWYSGCAEDIRWSIGLAQAEHPLGPWKKYEKNPVLEDFGYLGGVVKVDGKYRLYSAHPIHMPWAGWEEGKSRSATYHSDYSPLAVAIGQKPEGPFEKHAKNPLMVQGDLEDWDDGGISEAEVLYDNGMFHMFYGGTRRFGPRLESIGYAYSFDGFRFYKYGRNPVASRHVEPNAAAFAEVHAIIERPFIYLYHTLRLEEHNGKRNPWVENLGVQVLAAQRPFSLDMPLISVDSLGGRKSTKLIDCPPLCLGSVESVSLTIECSYAKDAKSSVRLHVRASSDGVNYDTADLVVFENDFKKGKIARKTFVLDKKPRFIKVLVENPGDSPAVSNVKVTAALEG